MDSFWPTVDYSLLREINVLLQSIAGITKVVTIEASGIAPALYMLVGQLDVPMIFAKKAKKYYHE